MTDAQVALVRKLRTEWPVGPGNSIACQIMSEAADEIETLSARYNRASLGTAEVEKRVKSLLQIQRGHQQEIEGLKRALDKRDAEIMALKAQVAGARDAALDEAAAALQMAVDDWRSSGNELPAKKIEDEIPGILALKSSAQSV
ncbi:hypothetical protein [Aquamicrobium zhengzhouense]|uniref:Uncharacterized protein n=1 Tax=Aquamicrobium zhengzhouense TaxID=2781738 RepID=A0ABS0SBI1_9HYPH|nr:hypothetical protein [Aquamicrobium zhengzhouense]MBI1620066.1 hypothetical protein [Aquamicrobium zhengzhouense]